MRQTPFYRSLYGQVLIATVIGVALGHFFPAAGASMKPLGDAFIRLVRMIVAPVVFCTVVVGIAGVGDVKAVGKAGILTLIYFEIVSTIALVIGLIVVNVVKPGAGMNVDPATLDAGGGGAVRHRRQGTAASRTFCSASSRRARRTRSRGRTSCRCCCSP